jgi:drug/metabolite transporter (DMT)-like permease
VFAQTEMLFVPIWALIVLGDQPRPSSIIGGTIIFAAVIGKALLDARPARDRAERAVTTSAPERLAT